MTLAVDFTRSFYIRSSPFATVTNLTAVVLFQQSAKTGELRNCQSTKIKMFFLSGHKS